jgi:hypothetical protein
MLNYLLWGGRHECPYPHPKSLSQIWERDFEILAPLLPYMGEGVGG